MEPIESFMEMLGRAWRDDDKQALARIFGNAPGHLQSVPDKYRGDDCCLFLFIFQESTH